MIKHKREEFLSDTGHRACFVSGLLLACAAVDAIRVYGNLPEEMHESIGMLVPAILFAALAAFFLLRGILKAAERQKRAIQSKRNFTQNGVLSHGKITATGGGYYQKGHYRVQHVRREQPRHFRVWESKWWAEIEYYDEAKGIYSRYKTTDLNQNAKRYLGRDVAIYRLEDSVYVDFHSGGNT